MKKYFVFLSLACLCSFTQMVSAQAIDVLHYKFEIKLSDQTDSIEGLATIQFIIKSDRITLGGDPVVFDLVNTKAGKGMIVRQAYMVSPYNTTLPFEQENNKLSLHPMQVYKTGDTATAVIYYVGIPADGLIISKSKYGERTFFGDNWPNRAHNWIPCIDNPADKASFEFWVTAPPEYKVVSNGVLIEEKKLTDGKTLTVWKENIPLSTKVMVIGVARFAVKTFADSPANIPVSAWVYPQDSAKGFRNYSVAPTIVKFFSSYIGAFPYQKLANVQSKTRFGGMENASAIFYFEESAASRVSVEDLLAHEIAHQWFGDMASEKSFAHLWLSEGFATYFTDIYLGSKYGTDSMNRRLQKERNDVIDFDRQWNKAVVDSASPFMELLNANSYQKGAWILHMLHRQLGDSVFHQLIRSYYQAYKGRNAETTDFEKIAEGISGKNLQSFFHQWLFTPGVPTLNVKWNWDEQKKTVSITIQQKAVFSFPLEIGIPDALGKLVIHKFDVSKATETFTFPQQEKPSNIILDPNTSLLFEESK